jgi:hypothetical protein
MSQQFHPLPHWLLSHPRRLHWIYIVQRWVLLRNHNIVPQFIRWFKQRCEQGIPVSMVDGGCGEGLFCYLAAKQSNKAHTNAIAGSKTNTVLGVDSNPQWIEFLSTNSAVINNNTSLSFHNLDIAIYKNEWGTLLKHCNSLVCVSVLQYMQDSLGELQWWLNQMPESGEVFLYLPVDHHQYTPWYTYVFNKFQNYEQAFNRSRPVGKLTFSKFIGELREQGKVDVVYCKYQYRALASIGHEQFSFLLMLWQNSNDCSQMPIKVLAGILLMPAWILSTISFYIDRLIPIGSPNSVLCILKKKAYIKE